MGKQQVIVIVHGVFTLYVRLITVFTICKYNKPL